MNSPHLITFRTILTHCCFVILTGPATCLQAKENNAVFAVDPIVDGGAREMAEISGLLIEGNARFQIPAGVKVLDFPNGNLAEVEGEWPAKGWGRFDPTGFAAAVSLISYARGGQNPKPADFASALGMPLGEFDFIVQRTRDEIKSGLWQAGTRDLGVEFIKGQGPEKTNLLRLTGRKGTLLRTPNFQILPNRPYLLSFWVRSATKSLALLWMDVSKDTRSGVVQYEFLNIPDSKGKWIRAGFYLHGRPDIDNARVIFTPAESGDSVELAGFEVREAGTQEMHDAQRADRARFPENVTKPSPGDGLNLGLSKAKLAGKAGVPGRPFVIWAIGSSWTNGLGRGEELKRMVREVYPDAPEIIYHARMGSGAPYDYVRGWAMTGVAKDQPDLVITYTGGTAEGLEELIKAVRSQTTADIIVPTLHFTDDKPLTPEVIESGRFEKYRDICRKYGVQVVENRQELAQWLQKNGKEPSDLRPGKNDVHQNRLGSLLTNENIWRHLVAPIGKDEIPKDRERIISLVEAMKENSDSGVRFQGNWRVDGEFVVSDSPEASIEFTFEGNRLDILGESIANGGTLTANVNGKRLDQLEAFSVSLIQQPDTNAVHGSGKTPRYPTSSGGSQATGPHGILLGSNIVPQNWRIEMLDNAGNFRLVGSKTGHDGEGNALEAWTSKSGQILFDPSLWRYANMADLKKPDVFSNHPGDFWPFTVTREVSGPISFRSDSPSPVDATLFKLAPNMKHVVQLTPKDGPVRLKALVAYRPPLILP